MEAYFSHDANARNDVKILRLRQEFGPVGYAAFFMTLEAMRTQCDFKILHCDIKILSWEFRIDELEKIIEMAININIFMSDGEKFWSVGLLKRMESAGLKSQKARESAKKRWKIEENNKNGCERNANAMPMHVALDANAMLLNKIKVNEIKEKESIKEKTPGEPATTIFKKPEKHRYGEFGHVLLTDDQKAKLDQEHTNAPTLIKTLDEAIELKGYVYKNHYLAIKKWVVRATAEAGKTNPDGSKRKLTYAELMLRAGRDENGDVIPNGDPKNE